MMPSPKTTRSHRRKMSNPLPNDQEELIAGTLKRYPSASSLKGGRKFGLTLFLVLIYMVLVWDQPFCNHHPSKPPLQYALMLDAGSSGSRIHVYEFSYCHGSLSPRLMDELFAQTKPGLSAYADDPVKAALSLDVLMEKAMDRVPKDLHRCTPVSLKATAGLRQIGAEKSNQILANVRKRLEESFPFPIADIHKPDGVAVMDGVDEGVYAWITVNYLSDRLGQPDKLPTVAIMDLGGGSTQIVFEPTQQVTLPDNHQYKYDLSFGQYTYSLYQQSYFSYGLNEIRRRIKEAAAQTDTGNLSCLPSGFNVNVKVSLPTDKNTPIEQQVKGTGGGFEQCSAVMTSNVLKKDQTCELKPCSFDGIYQPQLEASFPFDKEKNMGSVYAFSFFYDRTEPLGLVETMTVGDIKKLTHQVCSLKSTQELDAWLRQQEYHQHEEVQKEKNYFCLDLTYIYQLLSTGYELQDNRILQVKKKIQGFETGWCLGATIQMLDVLSRRNELVCKA